MRTNSAPTDEDFIAHYGILGMKWGIRRYQNADGSLTAAGKKRYSSGKEGETRDTGLGAGARSSGRRRPGIGVPLAVATGAAYSVGVAKSLGKGGDKSTGKKSKESEKEFKEFNKATNKAVEGVRRYRNAGNDNSNQVVNRYNTRRTMSQKEMDAMSDADLQKLVNRLNLETNYSRLTQEPAESDKVDVGLARLQAVMEIAGSAVVISTAGYKVAEHFTKKKAG